MGGAELPLRTRLSSMSNFSDKVSSLDSACLDAFGTETVIYSPKDGDPYEITLIDRGVPELEETKTHRNFFLRLDALEAAPERGDRIEIDSVRYEIHEIDPDEEGGVVLSAQRI